LKFHKEEIKKFDTEMAEKFIEKKSDKELNPE
jgi:hypothetical protein